jgi:hypothetical protein
MRVRTPFSSPPEDDRSIDSAPFEDDRSTQSVEGIFAHLRLNGQVDDDYDDDDAFDGLERTRLSPYRVGLLLIILVLIAAGGVFTFSGMRTRLSGGVARLADALGTAPTRPVMAQPARLAPPPVVAAVVTPPASTPIPPPQGEGTTPQPGTVALPAPEPVHAPADAAVETAVSVPQPSPSPRFTKPAETPASSPARPERAVSPAVQPPAPPAPAPLAAIAPSVPRAPSGASFKVRLSFTADQSDHAAVFAAQLRREGFKVTSIRIPVIHGRWPGVAFFFNADREKAKLIARQLAAVTGGNEHARLSPRHPYAKSGTIDVSLITSTTSAGRTSQKRARAHRLP